MEMELCNAMDLLDRWCNAMDLMDSSLIVEWHKISANGF